MAMACLRLFTFFPEPPLRRVPAFISCIVFSTFFALALLYLRTMTTLQTSGSRRIGDRHGFVDQRSPCSTVSACRCALENSQCNTGGQGRAEFFARPQVALGNVLWPQNFFRSLRVCANDERIRNAL